ncbi:ABC transporter substrate-binding protein [Alicyclobacillus sp. ALC3]|uniref:ABC transporter substrate-binding protein n=1 Tax=Alicyclobacillus sp. ALC3 TaxID=2796143 RepID=UPI0023784CD9|nr:ABC transporter substrate-binding protein [Alicyclobacillus sp. ALC3]WDL97910.1 ABC transporter substrate-binding protein [Alicyclobacillus sp. ALC3]
MSKKYVLGALAATTILGVVGCGSAGANPGSNGTGNSSGAKTTASSLTIVPNVTASFSDNFNPYGSTNMAGTQGNIYETLFYFDGTTGKQFNLLGKSFAFSNGNKTLTVQLRSNVKWSNGKTFSAADVVFTFNDLKKYSDADTNGLWQQLTSVTAPNPNEVVFNFKQANIPFAEQYVLGETFIVPKYQWSQYGDPSKVDITYKKAIGTGPYVLSSFSTQDYKFVPNKYYYLGVPKVPVLNYPAFASNSSADLALASGQVQWAGVDIPNIQTTYVNRNKNNHYYFPPNEPVMLYANLHNPLLSQLAVRQAMNLAINRQTLASKGESGYEMPASPTGLVLPPQQAWLNTSLPSSALKFTLNDAKAQQILKNAGFRKDSNGIYAKNGQELSFTLIAPSGWSDWNEDQLLISQELDKIGMKITVQEPTFSAYYTQVNPGSGKTPNYQLAMSYTDTGPTPYRTYYDMLDSKGAFNLEGYSNSQVDQLFNQFSATTNTATQKQVINKIQQVMVNQLPVIPLLNGALWFEYNNSGWTGWSNQSNLWIDPSPYTYQAAAIVLDHLRPAK